MPRKRRCLVRVYAVDFGGMTVIARNEKEAANVAESQMMSLDIHNIDEEGPLLENPDAYYSSLVELPKRLQRKLLKQWKTKTGQFRKGWCE